MSQALRRHDAIMDEQVIAMRGPFSRSSTHTRHRRWLPAAAALWALAVVVTPHGQTTPAVSAAGQVLQRLERGEMALESSGAWGYLPSLLRALDIGTDSQVLVFSKTSLQDAFISPATPRALYFNDEAAVGFVQGGPVLEVAVQVPGEGVAFYTVDNRPPAIPKAERRDRDCARCHRAASPFASGLLVTSTQIGEDGMPFLTASPTLYTTTDHRTPFGERWSGWYVTGTHGTQVHQGNLAGMDVTHPRAPASQNLTTLAHRFDTSKYLEPTSDLVALMTLEHQATLVDMIASVNAQFRGGGSPVIVGQTITREQAIDDLVAYLLFVEEAPLGAPVAGVSSFTKTFQARGRRDSRGRSLRDFDLRTRVFKYPMSYLIDSEFFLKMDAGAQALVYQRLFDVLTGKDTSPRFARLSASDRQAVLEILRDTHAALPGYWRPAP